MLYNIQLLVLLGAAVVVGGLESLNAAAEACSTELNITPGYQFNEINPEHKCFAWCWFKKLNIMNDNGELVTADFPSDFQYTNSCVESSKRPDPCDTATAFAKCVRKDSMTTIQEDCKKETNMDVHIEDELHIPIDYDGILNCYYRCIMVKNNAISEQNEPNPKMAAFINFEVYGVKIEDIIKTCVDEHKEADKCVQALRRSDCVDDMIKAYAFAYATRKSEE